VVLPVFDRNPVRRTPVVTYALIVANIVVFLLSPIATAGLSGGGSAEQLCRQQAFFHEYGAIPKELVTDQQLPTTYGPAATDAAGRPGCLAVRPTYDKTPFLSVLFSMFLHGGWLHLLGNMLFLFVFGNNIEDRLGRLRYLAFYLFCGYVAAYGYAVFAPDSTTTLVGASGAIAGVLGAYLFLYPRVRVVSLLPFLFFIPVPLPAWLVLGSWFLLQYAYVQGAGLAAGSSVAYLAHVIGFLTGVVLILPLLRHPQPPPVSRRWAGRLPPA
jgi:membrane associated rhomboid family serine protease